MSTLDKEAILDRLGGNADLLDAVCDRFTKLLPSQMSVISDAIAADDHDTVARSAHRLRGSVGYFDSQPVLTSIGELESMAKAPQFDSGRARNVFEKLRAQMDDLVAELKTLR